VPRPRGTIIHFDQGTQYGSNAWRRFCRTNHLEPSMSRKGNRWDNAVIESFFSSLPGGMSPERFEAAHKARAERVH
jgi:putative transposase